MKGFFTLLLTTILSAFCISFVAEAAIVINDYTMPKDLPEKYKSSLFSVLVEGEVIDTYKVGLNAWNNEVACCEFSSVDSVGITVTTNFSFSSARILPRDADIQCIINGNHLTFTIPVPQNVTIIFDEDFHGNTLHIFAQQQKNNTIKKNDANIIYF